MSSTWQGCLFSLMLLLAGCGGGSSDSSPPTGGGGSGSGSGGSNPLPPILINSSELDAFATVAVNLPESMLQIAHYTDTLAIQQSFPFGQFQLCENGGGRTISLNTGLPLTTGSVITDQLDDCQVTALDAVLTGEVTLTITNQQQTANGDTLTMNVDLSKVVFKGYPEITVLDTVNVTFITDNLLKRIQVKPLGSQVRFTSSDGDIFTLSQFQLSSELDLMTALYRNDYQGRITFNEFSQYLTVRTSVPLQGYLGEYPHQGQIELTDSQNNLLAISANQVVNSELANLKFNQSDSMLYYWNSFTEGTYWSWPGLTTNQNIRTFRHDNFDLIGTIDGNNLNDFPTLGTVTFLFSRPVASINSQSLNNFFSNTEWGYADIGAEAVIEGALVHITPKTALEPGATYRLGSFEAINQLGVTYYHYYGQDLTVNNAIRAVITKDKVAVSADSVPTLSASESIIAEGLTVTYQWHELTDFGVVFDAPNAISTSFTVPEVDPGQLLLIGLTVTDTLGRSHTTQVELLYNSGDTDVLYYESDKGDYIGQGQTRFLTTNFGQFNTAMGNKSKLSVNYEGQYNQDNVWWFLELATAEGTELQPGLYQNATRAAFKPAGGNGIDFFGDGRGCNTQSGWFEIFEIEFTEITNDYGENLFEVTSLAVDFVQHCEGSTPALRGKVRINSSHPL
ncbi:hypothetical protein [Arsukibacterium sp.]|uniref:hypothetical protein n=1 Tax=Arsukibacterium sp. TaxID=1977258 RepID=UPI001BD531A8|nr:hypothetical protein [Arsukibacterium sp.]